MASAFTPLERAALDGLAWELDRVAPDLAGQIAEALPGQRRVQGPVFLTETIVDRRRPNPPENTHGRLGTIHVQVDHLPHPIAFQVELVNGRLIALHGDAYGQDLSAVNLTGDVVDQVFALRPDGHPVPYDLNDRADAILEASPLRRLQANPDPEPAPPPPPPPPDPTFDVLLGRPGGAARPAADQLLTAVFGARTAPSPTPPLTPAEDDLVSLRIGVVALAVMLALFIAFVMDFNFVFAGIVAFWAARVMLKRPVLEGLARAIRSRAG